MENQPSRTELSELGEFGLIKKLTESPPKITSGHKVESVKYKREERIKV